MAELITEEQPRVKFAAAVERRAVPARALTSRDAAEADLLADLLAKAERAGLTPLLSDGLAAGNCAMLTSDGRLLVSRSGKRAGERASFVQVMRFERAPWRAVFRRFGDANGDEKDDGAEKPSSDTPLLAALLLGVDGAPPLARGARFVLHGHALADDDDDHDPRNGLALARRLGAPISDAPTLFSTPEDLNEVEKLLRAHPYEPGAGDGDGGGGLYVRRGHGFFLLAEGVGQLGARLERVVRALAPAAAPALGGGSSSGGGSCRTAGVKREAAEEGGEGARPPPPQLQRRQTDAELMTADVFEGGGAGVLEDCMRPSNDGGDAAHTKNGL